MFQTEEPEVLKRNSQLSTKPRSSTGSNITGKESQATSNTRPAATGAETEIPETVPCFDDAWKTFTETAQYKRIDETVKEHETELKRSNFEYVREAKAFQAAIDHLNDVRNKLARVRIRRGLSDDDTSKVLDEQERLLGRELDEAAKSLCERRETALKHQTELLLNLRVYHDARADANECFREFCGDEFKTLVPNLEYSLDFDALQQEDDARESVRVACDGTENDVLRQNAKYKQYEKLTRRELERQLRKNAVNKKWLPNYKWCVFRIDCVRFLWEILRYVYE